MFPLFARCGVKEAALLNQSKLPGTLFAIVGPSGAGKDTLINLARQQLDDEVNWHFVRRHITRPSEAGGEAHIETDVKEFKALVTQNAFALHWQAHGLCYGIARGNQDLVHNGVNVVVNLSRSILDDAVTKFPRVHVIHVTAPKSVLEHRLNQRGREASEDIQIRIERATLKLSSAASITHIVNDGILAEGADSFMAALKEQSAQAA